MAIWGSSNAAGICRHGSGWAETAIEPPDETLGRPDPSPQPLSLMTFVFVTFSPDGVVNVSVTSTFLSFAFFTCL